MRLIIAVNRINVGAFAQRVDGLKLIAIYACFSSSAGGVEITATDLCHEHSFTHGVLHTKGLLFPYSVDDSTSECSCALAIFEVQGNDAKVIASTVSLKFGRELVSALSLSVHVILRRTH